MFENGDCDSNISDVPDHWAHFFSFFSILYHDMVQHTSYFAFKLTQTLSLTIKSKIMWIVFAVFFMLFLMSSDSEGNVSAQS